MRRQGRGPRDARVTGQNALLTAALLLVLATAGFAAACGGATTEPSPGPASPPAYTDIEPADLAAMLEDKDFVLVNTHVPYEGEIEQTDLFLPYDQAAELVGRLPADKAAKIVVYCRSDRMSRIAADAWAEAGYTNLYNLAGGFEAWEQAGYPLLQNAP
jgi:rhodanese-related sulfurtransferase